MDDGIASRMQALLAASGFDKTMVGLEVREVAEGRARLRIAVSSDLQNLVGTLHGGAIATLVDVAGTLAIISADADQRPGVTTDLNVSYFSAGKTGEAILVDAAVLKSGKHLAYVSVDLRRESDGGAIAQGRMTKFLK
jgi:acyl-coenzyme A thioesterase 13